MPNNPLDSINTPFSNVKNPNPTMNFVEMNRGFVNVNKDFNDINDIYKIRLMNQSASINEINTQATTNYLNSSF
jgi:hypothetical protein